MAKTDFLKDPHRKVNGDQPTQADYSEPLDGSSASATVQLGDGTGEGRGFDGDAGSLGDKGIVRYLCEVPGFKDLEYGHAVSVRLQYWGRSGMNFSDVRLMGSTTSQTFESMVNAQVAGGQNNHNNAFNDCWQNSHGIHMRTYDLHPRAYFGQSTENPTYLSTGAQSSSYPSSGQWYQLRMDIIPSNDADNGNGRPVRVVCYRSRDGISITGHDEASYEDSALYMKTEHTRNQDGPQGFAQGNNWGWGFWGVGMRVGFSVSTQSVYGNADRRPVVDNFIVKISDERASLGI